MINLTGYQNCDIFIRKELKKANVNIIEGIKQSSSVTFSIIGVLADESESLKFFQDHYKKFKNSILSDINDYTSYFPFVFLRKWSYWHVIGYVPIETAQYFYNQKDEISDAIRIRGNAGYGSPEKRLKENNYILGEMNDASYCPPEKRFLMRKIADETVIKYCHIMTQNALNFFSETLSKFYFIKGVLP
ncbi:MAG: hypothetical protein GY756_21440 [bacterium]|nr:hypothetical protein [bacterium]